MKITKEQWLRIAGILLSAAIAVAAVFGFNVVLEQAQPRAVREKITIDARDDAYLYNGADLYVYSDDHATQKFKVDGARGDTTVAGDLTLSAQTAITLTNNGVLTPVGTFQEVQEASAVTVTIATSGYDTGDVLIIENLSAYTVLITDTTRSASPSLGQYDSIVFVFDGTGWVQLATSNN